MRILDVVLKKRGGGELTEEEISHVVQGYVDGSIPDYQVSAFLMAVFFQGMSPRETGILTRCMIASGVTMDLPPRSEGVYVDKHSTGGVGDKVSLVLAPLAAACGAAVPMMSGRSLGHTGGTLDKLESIPGYRTTLSPQDFARIIGTCGFAMTGQSREVVPADRQLYALRDVTGTVESVPLITSSILSKKFAEGADALVFDVKCGSGAFMKNREEAVALARSLVDTGADLGKKIVAVLTDMSVPLGEKVGNFLEIEETLAVLRAPAARDAVPLGGNAGDLVNVTLRLTAWMLVAAGLAKDPEEGMARCREALEDGTALKRWEENVQLQGGDPAQVYRMLGSHRAPVAAQITAQRDGVITHLDAWRVGMGAVYLGAGRSAAGDSVRSDVGFHIHFKPGDTVRRGDVLLDLWGAAEGAVEQAIATVEEGITISDAMPPAGGWHPDAMILEELTSL